MSLKGWLIDRRTSLWEPPTALISASVHLEDFPRSPADAVAMFAALPADASLSAWDDNGWIVASWSEPANDDDLRRLAQVRQEATLAAEFEEWKRQRAERSS